MSFDALLKKFFPVVIVALIGVMALFQAFGVSELLAAVLASQEAPAAANKLGRSKGLAQRSGSEKTSADPLLERNPFDPITGSLLGSTIDLPPLAEGPGELDPNQDPLRAPKCGDTQVRIVTESSDPAWSIAAIVGPGESDAKLRRIGDQVADKEVVYIGYNWVKASPAVWFADASQLCQALLFDPEVEEQPTKQKRSASRSKRKKRKSSRAVPDDIKAGIKKISDTEIHVERAVVDKILAPENQTLLMRSVRISPEQKNGKVLGVRLHGVRSDSLLGVLGLKSGDVLQSINGFEMGSPEKDLEAYARLRTANNLAVKVQRGGKPIDLDIQIK